MSTPTVSVLMAVHNGEGYLREALDSMVGQTFTDWEIVVVDDGSDDGTGEILRQYRECHRMTVVRLGRRRGVAAALNAGLAHCAGVFIARMDADDVSEPVRLEIQVAFMRDHPDVGMCSTGHLEFGAGPERYFGPPPDVPLGLLSGWGPSHPTVMFRRSSLEAARIRYNPRYRHAEDFDLFTRLAHVVPMGVIDEPLLRYRRHPGQASTARWARQEREAIRIQAAYIARCLWTGWVPRRQALGGVLQWRRRVSRYLRYEWQIATTQRTEVGQDGESGREKGASAVESQPESAPKPRGGTAASAISAVVIASQGCRHADAVISAVRPQLQPGDQLLVIESMACTADREHADSRELHVVVDTNDEAQMKVIGLGRARGEVLLALEDHGVPSPGFLRALRALFLDHPALDAATFFLRNGTPGDAPSRAVFAFVAGFADAEAPISMPRAVCSAFAIRRDALMREQQRRGVDRLSPNTLEYEVIPRLANIGLVELPRELTLMHFQSNSLRQAAEAIYWNARIAGSVQGGRGLPAGSPMIVSKRYLGRVVRLNQVKRRSAGEAVLLGVLGISGFAGWWVGKAAGPAGADDRIQAAHVTPAL